MVNWLNLDYIRFCSLHDNLRLTDQEREGRSNLYSLCIIAFVGRVVAIFGNFKPDFGVWSAKS